MGESSAALPSRFSSARAFLSPARTPSTVKLRTNSATAPSIVITILPADVEVSICSENETKSIPKAFEYLQSSKQMGVGTGESIEPPNAHDIESSLVYVCHQSVKLSTEFFRSANPIFDKLGISNRVELVLCAVTNPKESALAPS
jgi:hypothetical protein